jgi:hypothetical protein
MGAKLDLSLWGRNILRVFESRMLRKMFGPKSEGVDHGENCIMMSFMTCVLRRILLG